MMNTANRFEPLHDAHAIELVQFGFQFAKPLTDGALKRASDIADTFHTELPGRQELRNLSLSIGPGGLHPLGQIPSSTDGVLRQSVARNGAVERELRVERTGIGYRDASYTRWANVWQGCQSIVEPLFLALGEEAVINTVQLQYVDKFVWDGDPAESPASDALRGGSKYLAPTIFEARDAWHSHSGYFERVSKTEKRLVQVNIDKLEELHNGKMRPFIRAMTVAIDMLNQPGYEADETGFRPCLSEKMHAMHELLKQICFEIVNDRMARRIGMIQ